MLKAREWYCKVFSCKRLPFELLLILFCLSKLTQMPFYSWGMCSVLKGKAGDPANFGSEYLYQYEGFTCIIVCVGCVSVSKNEHVLPNNGIKRYKRMDKSQSGSQA